MGAQSKALARTMSKLTASTHLPKRSTTSSQYQRASPVSHRLPEALPDSHPLTENPLSSTWLLVPAAPEPRQLVLDLPLRYQRVLRAAARVPSELVGSSREDSRRTNSQGAEASWLVVVSPLAARRQPQVLLEPKAEVSDAEMAAVRRTRSSLLSVPDAVESRSQTSCSPIVVKAFSRPGITPWPSDALMLSLAGESKLDL